MKMKAGIGLIMFCLCLFYNTSTIQAQHLQGVIVNKKGDPIPNSTVYIKETAKGIAADNRGEFITILSPGNYTCEFRSLGYETLQKNFLIGEQDQFVRIVLEEATYTLDEVVVYASDEDPALRIMRKAIAYAPYYRYQIKEYQSEAYIKGSLTIDKIPKILKRAAKVNSSDIDINDLIGKPLVMESHSNIHFISPETYNQNVVALKSSIPKEFNISKGLSIMTSSIYNSDLDGRISPLAPTALRYYDFKLESVDYQPEYTVNKIRVIPRKKNPKLFSGYLYILENSWNVYIADLMTSEMGTSMHYRINYHQVKPSVYLPTTYDVTLTMNTLGVKGLGSYYASMKYNSVEVGDSRPSESMSDFVFAEPPPETQVSPKQQKAAIELERLSQKEQLSTKEAYKMSKLMNEMAEPEVVKEQRESLEIKDIERVKMEVDTLAWRRDSAFWTNIRELPLRVDEVKSYEWRDSLSGDDNYTVSEGERNEVVISIEENPGTAVGRIIQGGIWKMNDDSSLRYGGLMGALKEYNFVDGFWLGQTVSLNYAFDKNRSFSFSPSVYYTTAREKWLWNMSASLSYAPMRLGRFNFSAGHISRDINGMNGESRLMNTITSLYLGQSFIRFYDSRYVKANNTIDIANGLQLYTGIELDKRSALINHTSYNFASRDVGSNDPSSLDLYPSHTASSLMLGLTYTPRYRYRVREGAKSYVSSKYPTFSVVYEKGVNLFADNEATLFDKVMFSASQNIKVSPFSEIDYHLSGGSFLSSDRLYANDLHYYANNQMVFTQYDFKRTFNLLHPYQASSDWWMEGHLNYQSQYLLIKNLPFLQRFLFDEAVHLHGLVDENREVYLELGYSVGFIGLGRVGIFTGIADKKINGVGVRISYPLWSIIEKPFK